MKAGNKILCILSMLITFMTAIPVYASAAEGINECRVNCNTNNAAYLNSDWFSSKQTPVDITQYVTELAGKKIRYQFADIGLLEDTGGPDNGTLNDVNYAGLAQWIKYSKLADPDQLVIVTLNHAHRFKRVNGVKQANPNFGNDTFNTNLNALVDRLVNAGVQVDGTGPYYKADGVHLDFEGFMKNDATLLNTLQYLRSHSLASNPNFSMSAPADASYDGVSYYQWSSSFIHEAAGILNMINPMIYDQMGWGSDVKNAADYKRLWTNEIIRYSEAIGSAGPSGIACQLVPVMPSYERKTAEDSTVYHDPLIENLEYAVNGLSDALAGPHAAHVDGAAIFWWSNFIGRNPAVYSSTLFTADQANWMNLWVNRP